MSVPASGPPPAPGNEHTAHDVLAARLTTVAHPLHAAALTITAVTGANTRQLTLIRATDINPTATAVKIHDSNAHHHCRIYPAPGWARPLLNAASLHAQLNNRSPDSPLFPLITTRGAHQLALTATAIRYTLDPTPQEAPAPRLQRPPRESSSR
ncbi:MULTISPECIES: hypothetical protein [unclassified Streptomyces]|uniref:hypothetical protein n=1 Tax=unclassified Streptomyces TaxID=2593676 RepID=UPI003807C87B